MLYMNYAVHSLQTKRDVWDIPEGRKDTFRTFKWSFTSPVKEVDQWSPMSQESGSKRSNNTWYVNKIVSVYTAKLERADYGVYRIIYFEYCNRSTINDYREIY